MRTVPILVTTPGRTVMANEGETAVLAPVERGHHYKAPRYKVSLVKEAGSYWTTERQINSPSLAAPLAIQILNDIGADREYFYIIALDQKNKVIGINMVSMGTLTASVVHPREVFKALIMLNAASFIAFHNHPCGDPAPSEEDLNLTRKLVSASNIMGFRFLDHLIIGVTGAYMSIMETYPEIRATP
jgi:DNA repair protein RadC